jgi:tetratricopeptide (TPR) repeat protein
MKAFYALATGAHTGRGSALQLKHDNDKALADFNDAIRIDPQNAGAYVCRGSVWRDKSDYENALADIDEAIRCDRALTAAYVIRAWILAACPEPKFRDGLRAIASAKTACELTAGQGAFSWEALAAAYAEAGDFELAVQWQTKATAESNETGEARREQEARLELYRQKKPYRMPKQRIAQPLTPFAPRDHASLFGRFYLVA